MTRHLALIIVLAALAACAARPGPVPPECAKPVEKPPIDGGIGGTGKTDDPCAEREE